MDMYNFHNLHIASPPPPDPSFSPAATHPGFGKRKKKFCLCGFLREEQKHICTSTSFCLGVFSLEEQMCIGSANREKLLLCWGHYVCLLGSVVVIVAVPSKSQASGALVSSW
jgi:hypothetical protein